MKAEIISIGTELLLGHIVNTNAAFLSNKLAELGLDVYYQSVVGDNPQRLNDLLEQALRRSDIVVTSGGLGPTVDDITIEAVARLLNRKLTVNKAISKDLKAHFRSRGIRLPSGCARQAYIPEGVKWIRNRVGTAPGLICNYKERVLICLPGPPRELEPMFVMDVAPYIKSRFKIDSTITSRLIKTSGLPESQVNWMVKDLLRLKPPVTVGIYARPGEVDLKIMAKMKKGSSAEKAVKKIEAKIRRRLGRYIFGYDGQTLEAAAGAALMARRKTVAVAESCTGGLVSDRLTDVSGSSKYFIMGIAAYSNRIKTALLGVPESVLARYGAVSKETALRMARGVKYLAGTDVGVGITGIAGPTGWTKSKPLGLVYIAFVSDKQRIVKKFIFKGLRREVKFQASQAALDMIRKNV